MKLHYKKIIVCCILYTSLTQAGARAQDTLWTRKSAPENKETYAVSFSADGAKVFSGSECSPSYLRIFNTVSGSVLWDYETGGSLMCIQGVKMSSDGTKAAAIEEMGNLLIFDYSGATPALVSTVSTGTYGAFALDFSPDGSRIVTGCTDKKMNIYTVAGGTELHTNMAHSSWVMSVDWSPAGIYIVSGGNDNLVKLWDSTGTLVRTMSGHTGAVQSVRFSSDGEYIISGSKDDKIKIWETATGNLIRTLAGHRGDVTQVDISDDRTKIVSGSADSTIRTWSFATGSQLMSFGMPNSGKVYTVDFSPNNHYVATGTSSGDVQLWDIDKATDVNTVSKPNRMITARPNPFTEELQIAAEGAVILEVTLSDITGQVILRQPVTDDRFTLKPGSLSAGQYLLTTRTTTGTKAEIMIKQ